MPHPSSEPAESRTAIAVKDLSYSHGRSPTVVGLKWELPAGCVAALFGHSGSGKSTLLALLAGALAPSNGSVEVWGTDPSQSRGRQNLGYMPQVGGLYAGFTVEENLRTFAVGAGPHGSLGAAMLRTLEPFVLGPRRTKLIDGAIDRTLEKIQLAARRHEPVGQLSAALQQRVSLGIAMLWDPHVLLLDAPLSLADDQWTATARGLFKAHAAAGGSVLFTTGDAREALTADHLTLLRAGRLLSTGRTDALVPAGKARVQLKYMLKTGPIAEEVEVMNLAGELPGLMDRKPNVKPVEVLIHQDARDARLAALLDLA